jgi:protein MpaA
VWLARTTRRLLRAHVAVLVSSVLAGTWVALAASRPAASSGPLRAVLGRSVRGRPIEAVEIGGRASGRRVLVVGCIHGNECAGIAIARRLQAWPAPRGVELWIVPDLNPDGRAAGTRGNARGVDLNRNFPWRWRKLSGLFDSGSRPLSEPESRIAARLIRRVRPQISIWFHQHLAVVDESGGNAAVERRMASLAGLPLARLPREPGSVIGWENHLLPGTTAFAVELPPGALTATSATRYARAVEQLAEQPSPARHASETR